MACLQLFEGNHFDLCLLHQITEQALWIHLGFEFWKTVIYSQRLQDLIEQFLKINYHKFDIHSKYSWYNFKLKHFRYVFSFREKMWPFVTGAKPPEKSMKLSDSAAHYEHEKPKGKPQSAWNWRSKGVGYCLEKKERFALIVLIPMYIYLKIKLSSLKVARLLRSTLYENLKPMKCICTQLRC